MITLNAVLAAGIHHDSRAHDIRLQENSGILNRAVNMTFSCEIDQIIEVVLLEELSHQLFIADITLDKDVS